jgi:hypothetical protein
VPAVAAGQGEPVFRAINKGGTFEDMLRLVEHFASTHGGRQVKVSGR